MSRGGSAAPARARDSTRFALSTTCGGVAFVVLMSTDSAMVICIRVSLDRIAGMREMSLACSNPLCAARRTDRTRGSHPHQHAVVLQ